MAIRDRRIILSITFSLLFAITARAQDDATLSADEQEQLLEQKKDEVEDTKEVLAKKQKELDDLQKTFAATRTPTTKEILESFSSEIESYNGRAYKLKDGTPFPAQLKCTSVDYRMFHGCLELRFFDPSARVYFDTGSDDVNEIDLFNDGNLNVTVDLVSIYFPWRLGKAEFYDSWSWGPVFGAGISAAAKDSDDGSAKASGAPVVLISVGAMLEYKLKAGPSFSFEVGRSTGFSSDESLGDIDDSALFVGLRINVPIGDKKAPKAKANNNPNEQ